MKTNAIDQFRTLRLLFILILASLCSGATLNAQNNGINYKAQIKDGSGNLIANQSVTVQLSVLEGTGQALVYQETHTPTTDANGIVILNIGDGTVDNGVYSNISWGSFDHFLNVQVNTGSGLVDLGSTEFKAVPYALNAANVTGLEAIDEGNGLGWRLIGRNTGNYGNIGINGIDLSYSSGNSTTNGAIGAVSFAAGQNTEASGIHSIAMGHSSIANGNYSSAIGNATTSPSFSEVAIGRKNTTYTPNSIFSWDPMDRIFVIGNGDNSTFSDALTVLKNGTITAPSFDLVEITDDKALITKEYADANLFNSGLVSVTEAGNQGWRLSASDPANYGDIGTNALDFSQNFSPSATMGATGNLALAVGLSAKASGLHSIAIGDGAEALGSWSTAIGKDNLASGSSSIALGEDSEALGIYSLTAGRSTKAIADYAVSLGFFTEVDAYNATAIGSFNIGGGTEDSWEETDPLFEIGNGTSPGNLSNALTVLKNGTIMAPTFDISEITDVKALITKEYADTNLGGSGLEAIDEGNGNGWRLKGQDPVNYGNIGTNATDFSISFSASTTNGATGYTSFASGNGTTASGNSSTAMGEYSKALGVASIALGYNNTASGIHSTAMGHSSMASASYSTAMGFETTASGNISIAMGNFTTASGLISTAMGFRTTAAGDYSLAGGFITNADSFISAAYGRYNIGGGTPDSWIETDPLFEIGNGDNTNRANALTVLKNGKVGIGEHQPSGFLEVKAVNSGTQPNINLIHEGATGARINFTNTDTTNGNVWTLYGDSNDTDANSSFNLYHPNAGNIVQVKGDGQVGINGNPDTEFHVHHGANAGADGFTLENTAANTNSWRMYVVNSTGNLNLFSKIQGATSVGNFNDNTGVYSSTSDRRLKRDFKQLSFNWDNFMKLETLSYLYKAQTDDKRSLGLIAQDVELIYPELVTYNQEDDVYHLNYSGFGVVAIKAVQELKTEVDRLKEENNVLRAELLKFTSLEARLSALEANNDKSMQDSTRSEIKKE